MSKISLILNSDASQENRKWRKLIQEFIWLTEGSIGKNFFSRKISQNNIGKYLNLGCGTSKYEGWVNADYFRIYEIIRGGETFPDWMLDATSTWNCPDNFFGGIYSEHALEHISYVGVVKLLQESFRTLQHGKYIRIILPDLSKYTSFYNGELEKNSFNFPDKTLAISSLTQSWGHISAWDEELLIGILSEIGFVNVIPVGFQQGSDKNLLQDTEGRQWESLYVEAQKPK